MAPHTHLLARAGRFRAPLDLLIRVLIFSFIFSLIPVISAPPARAEEIPNEIALRKVSDTRYNLSMNLLDEYTEQEISVRIRRISGGTSQIITLPSKKLGAEGKATIAITQKLEKDDVLLFVLGNKVVYKENFVDVKVIDLTGAEPSPAPTAVETAPAVAEVPNEIAFRKVNDKRYNLSMNLLDRYAGRDLIIERVRGGVTTLIGRLTLKPEGRGAIAVNEAISDNDLFLFRSGTEIVYSQKFSEAEVIDLTAPTPSPSPSPTTTPSPTSSAPALEEYPNEVAFKEVNKKKYYLSMNFLDQYANKQIVVERRRSVKGQVEVVKYPPKTLRAEGKATITISEALLPGDDFLFRYRGKVFFKQNFGTATLLVVKDGTLVTVRTAAPTPVPTPSVVPTPTSTPTPSVVPTPTPSVTPTPTPTPVVDTPTPVYSGGGGGAVFTPVVTPPVVTRYSVSFDSNTADTGTVPATLSNKNVGDVITLPSPDTSLVKSDHRFVGWNLQADGASDFYFPGETFTVGSANRTFYAFWTDEDWKIVKYFANGPNLRPRVSTGLNSGPLLGAAFARTGYVLASWNTSASGSGGTSYALNATYNFSADINLYAQWIPNDLTVTVNQTTGGTISPGTGDKAYGSTETYTATATIGYRLVNWTLDGNGVGSANTYVLSNIRTNRTISAIFAIETFTVTVLTPVGGSISPSTRVKNYGGTETFTANAAPGYHFAHWMLDSVDQVGTGPFVLSNIRAAHTVTAHFEVDTFTVTVADADHGDITPGSSTKFYGANETYTAIPETGYHLVRWEINSVSAGSANPLLITDIRADKVVTAVFAIDTFTVTVEPPTGGNISPLQSMVKNYGSSETFTATPNAGYHLVNWQVGGVNVGSTSTYVLSDIRANKTITAIFTIDTYTLTVTQSTGGTISPSTVIKNHGSSETFTIVLTPGYHLVRWEVDNVDAGSNPIKVLNNITAHQSVSAVFALDTFTVTVNQPIGGLITPITGAKTYGSTETYTATANDGYHFVRWVIDGSFIGNSAPYVLSNVIATHTISAQFAIDTYTVTVLDPDHGSITPESSSKNYGSSETYTATADDGYHLVNWLLDSVNVGSSSTYVLSDIRANKTLSAVFAIDTFTVTVSQATNGTISASASVVNYGDTFTITAEPVGGYLFSYWVINGSNVLETSTYVVGPITENMTISALFSLDEFGITVVQPANGRISPESYVPAYGTTETFTATANTGYHFVKWVVDGLSIYTAGPYVLTNIISSHTISAQFTIDTFTLTVIQPNFGRVSPGTVIKNYGSTETYTATADTGYHLNRWFKDGSYLPAAPTLVIESITAHHSVSAEFVIDTFTITVNQTTGGTISPSGSAYDYGSTETFTITLDPGYHLEEWLLDGVSQGNVSELVLTNISDPHVVTATYDRNIYPITVIQPEHGSITPSDFGAFWGDSETFTVTVNNGYHLSHWQVDGVNVGNGSTYVLSNIESAETITAVIVIDTFTVTVLPSDFGTVTPGTTVVDRGGTETFTAIPDSGYRLKYWEIEGVNSGSDTTTVLSDIQSDLTVTAIFELIVPDYSVTYHIGIARGVAPVDTTRYREGSGLFLLSPDSATLDGYAFAGWSIDPQDFRETWGATSYYEMGGADLNFYALWKRSIPVYFIYDSSTVTLGGETTTSMVVMEDDIITPIFEAADGYVISRFTVNGVPTAAYVNGQLLDNPNSIRADLYLGPIRETMTIVVSTELITGHTVTYLANNGPNSISLNRVNRPDAYTVEDFGWTHYDSNLYLAWYEDSYGDAYRVGDVINLSGPETLTAIYRELIPFTIILDNPETNTLTFDGVLLDSQNPQHTFMLLPGRDFTVAPAPVTGQRVARFVGSLYNDIWEGVSSVQINWYELEETFTVTFESFAFTRVYYMPLEDFPELDVTDDTEYQPGDVITFLEAGNRGRLIGSNAITVSWFEGPFDGSREFRPGETLTADTYDLYIYPIITDYREVVIRPEMNFYQDSISEESITVSFNVPLLYRDGQDYLVADTDDLVVSIQVSDEYRIMNYGTNFNGQDWNYSYQLVETRTTINIGENLGYAQINVTLDLIPYGWEFNAFGSGSESDTEIAWDDGYGSRWYTPDYYFDFPNNQASRYWIDQNQVRHEPDVNEPLSGDSSFTLYPEMESFHTLEIIVNDPSRGYAWLDLEGDRDYDTNLYAVFVGESATVGIEKDSGETLTGAMLNGRFIPVTDFTLNYVEQYDYEYYTYTIESITGRTTFEAILEYTPYNYTVNFSSDGGVGTQSGFSGTEPTFVMPAIQFTKSGYSATCWKEESTFLWARYCAGDRIAVGDLLPASVLNFYPDWERVPYSYTATLNPGYGSGTPFQLTSSVGTEFTVPVANESAYNFVRDGWKMIGWNTAADMSGTRYVADQQAQVYSETPTLYAEWAQCYNNDCSDWDSRPRNSVISAPLQLFAYVGQESLVSHTSVGVDVRYPSFKEIAGYNTSIPHGLKFIGWNSNPNPDQGRWHLPGDSVDVTWWNSQTTYSGTDLDAFDDILHAFFSPTCSTYVDCDEIYAAVLVNIPSESYSVISGGPRVGNFVKLGETATVLFNFQRGYGVTSAHLFGTGYSDGFTNITLNQAYLFEVEINRLRFDAQIVYFADQYGNSGPGGVWPNISEHIVESYSPTPPDDFEFIGWATTLDTATAGIVEYVEGDLRPIYSTDWIAFYPVWRSLIAAARVTLNLTNPELGNSLDEHIYVNEGPVSAAPDGYRMVLGDTGTLYIELDDIYIIDYILINGETATYTDSFSFELNLGLVEGDVDVQIFAHHQIYDYRIIYSTGEPDLNIEDVVVTGRSGWIKLAGPDLFGVRDVGVNGNDPAPAIVTGWSNAPWIDGGAGEVFELLDNSFDATAYAYWQSGFKISVLVDGTVGGSISPINLWGQETITQASDVYGLYDQPSDPFFSIDPSPGYSVASITYNGEELLGATFPGSIGQLYSCEEGPCYIYLDNTRVRQNETLTVRFSRPYDYRLTFNANGGYLQDGETTTPIVGTGAIFNYPDNRFARSGYRFNGWTNSVDRNTVHAVGETETLTNDVNWTLYANWEENLSGVAVVLSPGIGLGETQTIYLETGNLVLPELPSSSPVGDLYPLWWQRSDGGTYFPGETVYLNWGWSDYMPETLTVVYQAKIPLTLVLANPESGTLTFDGILLDSSNPSHTFMMIPGVAGRIVPTPNDGYYVESFASNDGFSGLPWPNYSWEHYLGFSNTLQAETLTITFGIPAMQVFYETIEDLDIQLPEDGNVYHPGDIITLATLEDYGLNERNTILLSNGTAITSWRVIDQDVWTNYDFGDTLTAGLYSIGVVPVFTDVLPVVVNASYGESGTVQSDINVAFSETVYLEQLFDDSGRLLRGYAPKSAQNLTTTITARSGLEIRSYEIFDGNYQLIESGTVYGESFTVNLGSYQEYTTIEVSLVDPTFNYEINVLDTYLETDPDRSMTGRWSTFIAPSSYFHPVDQSMVIEWQDGNGNSFVPGEQYPVPYEGYQLTIFPIFTEYVTVDFPDAGSFNGYSSIDYYFGMFDYPNQILTIPIGDSFTYKVNADDGYALTGISVNDISYIEGVFEDGGYWVFNYGPVLENITVAVNVDLERTQFDVNFNFNLGADGPEDFSGSANLIELPMEIPTRAGYTFMGWRDVDFSDGIYQAGDSVDISSFPSISLYFDAIWQRSIYNYEINFDPGYGTGTGITLAGTGNQFIYDEEAVNEVIQPGNIERTGWEVSGWNTRADMTGTSYDTMFTLDLYSESYTLFAEWIRCYNGDCSLNDNRPVNSGAFFTLNFRVDYNETTSVAAFYGPDAVRIPTMQELLGSGYNRTGAQFIGWNSAEDGTGDWYLPGDRYDTWMGDESLGQDGWDTTLFPGIFYAFYSTTCSVATNCNDIAVPIRFTFDSHINSVTTGSEHSAEYYVWGSTVNFQVTYQTGYCLNTITRDGFTFGGNLETLTVDRAMIFDLTSSRCVFDVSVYFHDATSPGSMEGSYVGALSDYVLDVADPVRADYTFLGWALTPNGSPIYQRGSTIMVTGNLLELYAIWRYNFVSVTINLVADNEDGLLPDISDYIGVNGDRITEPLWLQRGPNGTVAETITINTLNGPSPYIIDSITVLGEVLDCTSLECPETEIEFTALDTDTVINVYAHHRVFNYSITYVGIDTSTTITGSGPSVTLADASIFGLVPSVQDGDSNQFVSGWRTFDNFVDPAGLRFALEGDFVETYTAEWSLGYQVDVSVANGIGGTIRWVYPAELSNFGELIFSTRDSQSTFWFEDQAPYLPYFKVEADEGYEIYSIKFGGGELIDAVYDASYRGGSNFEPTYQCDLEAPTECYFTLADLSDRVRIGELVFEFRPKYSYSIAFDAAGGTLMDGWSDATQTGSATRYYLPEPFYTKAGHDFMGWMDSDGLVSRTGNFIDITSDLVDTFTAVWQIQSYVVSFVGIENASVDSTSGHQGPYEYDSSDTFEVTANEGFCVGSDIDVDGESMINMSSYDASRTFSLVGIRGDLTLTFEIHDCAYQYVFGQENNDGSNTGIPVSGGTDRYLTLGIPTSIPDGARFRHWATSADGSGDTYTARAVIDLTTESFTASNIYAQWAVSPVINSAEILTTARVLPSTSAITTNVDSFIASKSCQYLEYWNGAWHDLDFQPGADFNVPGEYIARTSDSIYHNDRIVCSNISYIPGTQLEDGYTIVEGNLVVRMPHIIINYVTLVDGLTVPQANVYNYAINTPSPSRDGYAFLGWSLSSDPTVTEGARSGLFTFWDDYTWTFYAKWQADLSNASITEPETGTRLIPVDEVVAPTTETAQSDPVIEEVLPAVEPEAIVVEAPAEPVPASTEPAEVPVTT